MNHKEIAIRVYQEIGAELNTEKMIINGWHKVDLGGQSEDHTSNGKRLLQTTDPPLERYMYISGMGICSV